MVLYRSLSFYLAFAICHNIWTHLSTKWARKKSHESPSRLTIVRIFSYHFCCYYGSIRTLNKPFAASCLRYCGSYYHNFGMCESSLVVFSLWIRIASIIIIVMYTWLYGIFFCFYTCSYAKMRAFSALKQCVHPPK